MIQHDITNDKYYNDGVEITPEEYAVLHKEWEDSLPPPSTEDPDIDEFEALDILLGGAV